MKKDKLIKLQKNVKSVRTQLRSILNEIEDTLEIIDEDKEPRP